MFIFIILIVQLRHIWLKECKWPCPSPMLVSDEREFDPSVDLTTETGETFLKLTARV